MKLLESVCNMVWGVPMLAMLLLCGLYYTIRLRGIQFSKMGASFSALVISSSGGEGDLSPFESACIALAATIGTGNIVGVASAILIGGPGAIFWMWASTLVCLPLRFVEGWLGCICRRKMKGGVLTGAFLYIERVGKRFGRTLAFCYAFFCLMSSMLGMGTMVQSRSITDAVLALMGKQHDPSLFYLSCICGLCIVLVTSYAVSHGVSGIGRITSVLVPLMLTSFSVCGITAIIRHSNDLPRVLSMILEMAFTPKSALVGTGAFTLVAAMRAGISKGVFTNESGTGTAAFSAGAAQITPEKAGLGQMGIAAIDTLIVCTITALTILCTGTNLISSDPVTVCSLAFNEGFPIGALVVQISLILFAFSSSIGVYYYGQQSLRYLTGGTGLSLYHTLFLLFIFLGSVLPLGAIWYIADIFNGMLAYFNVPALLLLGGVAVIGCKAAGGCKKSRLSRNAQHFFARNVDNAVPGGSVRKGKRARI